MTIILNRAQAGDPKAASELLPLVYDELRKLAARMTNEAAGHRWQPTVLGIEERAGILSGGGGCPLLAAVLALDVRVETMSSGSARM